MTGNVYEYSPQELHNERSKKQLLLIDLREAHERRQCHIGGLHIPFGQLAARAAELPVNKQLVLYCQHGERSYIGALLLLQQGHFQQVAHLKGGLHAWQQAVDHALPCADDPEE